ncbi:hypothetical protein JCM10450v2_008021 [Rhodotorula kratochvilovae]
MAAIGASPPPAPTAVVEPPSPTRASSPFAKLSLQDERSTGARRPVRTVMLGHWHQRTWDLAHALNRTGVMDCFAAVTDMQDALVVLKSAIVPAELLVCSSYYPLEDIQELLLDYEGEINILIARPDHMNTEGAEGVAKWAALMVESKSYLPKTGVLSPSGYMRRLSATSQNSNQDV